MSRCRLEFPGTAFAAVSIPARACLPLHLDVGNSPLLFGCRSGLCGTCLIEVEAVAGTIDGPDADEAEALALYAPGNPKARLACQLELAVDARIRKISSA